MIGRSGRFYYGWIIVAIAFLCAMISVSTTIYAFGLFTLPASRELGLSRADFNTGFILFSVACGLYAPLVGRLADRFALRIIMAAGAVVLGASLVALGWSRSLVLDGVLLALALPFGFVATGTLPGYVLVARWFRARRGRAMAIAAIGQSASGMIGGPIVAALIETQGWRAALTTMGIAGGVALLLLAALVVERPRPGDDDAPAVAAPGAAPAAADRTWTMAELLRAPQFWLLALSGALILGSITALMVTIVPFAVEQGIAPVAAAALVSALAVAGVVAKFGLVVIADRVDRFTLMAGGAAILVLFNVALLAAPAYEMLMLACVIAGLGTGTAFPLLAAAAADRFGTASYGTVQGLLAPGISLATALLSRYFGEVYDRTGGYGLAFLTAAALLLAAAAALIVASRRARTSTVEPRPAT